MPSVKVCIWNIQNYGAGKEHKWGKDSNLRNYFIREFVRQQKIDVMLIMEASGKAGPSLLDLLRRLNGGLGPTDCDWALSLCGSALAGTSPNPPTKADHLVFKTDGRSEGYAVLWRTNRKARFRMLKGLNRIGIKTTYLTNNPAPPTRTPLNLSTFGRPAGMAPVKDPNLQGEEWRALGGYTLPDKYPYDKANLMNKWPDLLLPTTSTRNPRALRLVKARRPAYVVLELNRGGGSQAKLCPVAAYHAPSNRARAEWGAMQSGLARELYVTNELYPNKDPDPAEFVSCDRSVFGGDFNYGVKTTDWPSDYRYFVAGRAIGPDGGAQRVVAPDSALAEDARCTTVQLMDDDHKTPINSDKIRAYMRYKIDLVFFPQGNNGMAVNIPDVLLKGPNKAYYKGVLKAFHAGLDQFAKSLQGPNYQITNIGAGPEEKRRVKVKKKWEEKWVPMLCGSWGASFENWEVFMEQLQQGDLKDARRAAEFFHIFVSDHLPLVVEIKL